MTVELGALKITHSMKSGINTAMEVMSDMGKLICISWKTQSGGFATNL